jgi:hypothetical protein
MRRVVLTTVASVAVLALAPASALASHHHKRHHRRVHHARVSHRRFGDMSASSTTTPSTTTAPAAGTVDSFMNGVLTIKLNDGSTVSGAVTNDTEIECEAARSMSTFHGDDHGGGDNSGPGGGDNSGPGGGDDRGDRGDDRGDRNDQGEEHQNCNTADLTPGAMVGGAELRLSSTGASWDKVDLIG